MEANWASTWGVGRGDFAVSLLRGIVFFSLLEFIYCFLKFLVAQGLLEIYKQQSIESSKIFGPAR